jgi:hypothetical protein
MDRLKYIDVFKWTLNNRDNMTEKKDKSTNVPVIWQTGRHKLVNKRHESMFRRT